MPEETKQAVFNALTRRIGKDLIVSVHEVKTMFNLNDQEFYPVYKQWLHSDIINGKTVPWPPECGVDCQCEEGVCV